MVGYCTCRALHEILLKAVGFFDFPVVLIVGYNTVAQLL